MPRPRVLAVLALVVIFAMGGTGRALAHPHIWIDAYVDMLIEGGKVTGLRIHWTFDPFFSGMAAADFDTDGDGALGDDEVAALAANSADALKDSGFFTHVWIDGEPLTIPAVENFDASVRDDLLNYAFTVVFPEPVDPRKASLDISLHDPSYYVEITMDSVDPLRFAGGQPPCLINVLPDPQRTIYFGLVRPTLMQLLCSVS